MKIMPTRTTNLDYDQLCNLDFFGGRRALGKRSDYSPRVLRSTRFKSRWAV